MNIAQAVMDTCEAGAQAMQRYRKVLGDDPRQMPELFLALFIFDDLDGRYTFTVETSARTLFGWHADSRTRQGLGVADHAGALATTKGWQVDLVMFEGNGPKDQVI